MRKKLFANLLLFFAVCITASIFLVRTDHLKKVHAQSYTRVPSCGLNNNQNPYIPGTGPSGGTSNWATFTAPAIGVSYVDALTGCTVTRITNNALSSNQYPSLTSISADDKFVLINNTSDGSVTIATTPAYNASFTPGTVVVTAANMPGPVNGDSPWDLTADTIYYPNGNALMSATITGMPGCISGHTCTMTTATVHTFSACNSIYIMDEADISLNNNLAFLCFNTSGTSTMGVDTWNLTSSTQVTWYTTSSACKSTPSNQPNCLHKLQLTNLGEPLVTFNNNGTGTEEGTKWYHGSPTITATLIQNATNHFDTGQDNSGNEVFAQDRLDSSIGTDPCPASQWSGSAGNGGTPISLLTAPTTSINCILNKVWSTPHISFRGNSSQPWLVESFFEDGSGAHGSGGPEEFSSSGSYHAPTGTSNNPPTATTTQWYIYEDEIVMYPVDNNNSLTYLYRLAQARSRSNANFWAQVNASLSRDGNYVAFTSNMAYPSGSCTTPADSGCTDVYIVSGASGGPIFASSGGGSAPPNSPIILSNSLPAATTGTAYSTTLAFNGATGTPVWSVNPTLPSGLTLSPSTGTVSGTPTTAGSFPLTFTLTASDGTASAVLDLVVNTVTQPTPKYVGSTIPETLQPFTAALLSQTIKVIDTATVDLPVTVTASQPWISVSPATGDTGFSETITVNLATLPAGTSTGTVIFTAPSWSNSPLALPVQVTVAAAPTLGFTCATSKSTATSATETCPFTNWPKGTSHTLQIDPPSGPKVTISH